MASSSAAPPPSQTELEEKLRQFEIQLFTPPSTTRELLCLIEEVESALYSIGQDAPESIRILVDHIREALAKREIMRHSDESIEVSVASCVCEIMRITAPIQPYDDDKMTEAFHHLIASLEKLPNVVSCCYRKAVSILARMVKIRGFVKLLDLDCVLAINIFQLPLKIIRRYHPDAVQKNMEELMVQLIEESDVSVNLLTPLLESLGKETQREAPQSSVLGHRVLEKCADRLKPFLLKTIKFLRLNLVDHSDTLRLICHEVPEGEDVVEKGGDVSSVEGTSVVQLLSDTPITMDIDSIDLEHIGSLKTLKCYDPAEQLKDTEPPTDHMHKNMEDLQQQMNLSGLPEKIKPGKGQDSLPENKNCVEEPNNKKEHEKQSGSSSENATSKESAMPSETEECSLSIVLSPNRASTVCPRFSPTRNTDIDSRNSRRSRPKKSCSELTMRKGSKRTRSSKGNRGRGSRKNEGSTGVIRKEEKETLSDTEKTSFQQSDLGNRSTKTKRSRKHASNNEKDSKKRFIAKDCGEEVVGAKVRVWWPLDRMFYEGVISSFDPETKKHTVLYFDEDVEILNLKDECWEMLEEFSDKEESETDSTPLAHAFMIWKKKKEGTSKNIESGASSSERSEKSIKVRQSSS